jgi:hypothetical protein
MRNKLIILLCSLLFSLSSSMHGQKLINSPFSRFNIGSMEPAGSFRSQGMGGLGVSLRDNSSISFTNPASYSSIDTNSFIFDFGLDYSISKLSEGGLKYKSDDLNFDHLIIGFPLAKGFGFAAGVVPLSNGYYKMQDAVLSTDAGYDPLIGEYTVSHGGEGGFTSLFLGTGIKLNKNFSAGINMSILFGQIRRTNQFNFEDVYNVYHNNSTEKLQLGGINFDFGIQYSAPLKNKHFINAGISLTTGKHYNTDYENLVFRFTSFGYSDTMSYTSEKSKSTFIPGTFRAGISFGKLNKFTAGIDFIASNWSQSVIPGSTGYAADTRKFLFGVEYTPDKTSNFSMLQRLDYRLGGHAGSNYLIIGGEQMKEAGASFGIGLPMKLNSKANLFFDFTRKASSNGSLPTDDYYTIGLSINLYDRWFFKRKYD